MSTMVIEIIQKIGLPAAIVAYFLVKDFIQGGNQIKAFTELCTSLTNFHTEVKERLDNNTELMLKSQNDITVCKTLLRERDDRNT